MQRSYPKKHFRINSKPSLLRKSRFSFLRMHIQPSCPSKVLDTFSLIQVLTMAWSNRRKFCPTGSRAEKAFQSFSKAKKLEAVPASRRLSIMPSKRSSLSLQSPMKSRMDRSSMCAQSARVFPIKAFPRLVNRAISKKVVRLWSLPLCDSSWHHRARRP